MDVTEVHKRIVKELRALEGTAHAGQSSDSYTGSKHTFYAVPVPSRRQILKAVVREHKEAKTSEWLQLATALVKGRSHEEKTMGAYLLGYVPDVRHGVSLTMVGKWLSELSGWAEIDSLCQNVFQPEEMFARWKEWETFLKRLSKDTNINKRRASLVFLTGPTAKSSDIRLHKLAYELSERLKGEKDIIITKAVSWLLRSMAETRPREVRRYVAEETDSLPKIAVRETTRKLRTGKKN